MNITGAELFIKALKAEGTEVLFAYPGGQVIDLFDALYDETEIEIVLPRHEQGLIHAADGYARSTGKVGICLVTSGPGATNLVTGIATANYDSVPLVCFTGQVSTELIGSSAFQEIDIVSMTKNIAKYTVSVRKREDLADAIKRAFFMARNGRPGVAVVELPKDIQKELGSDIYVPYAGNSHAIKNENRLNMAFDILSKAKRPIFLIGGGVNIADAGRELTMLAELMEIPVVTTIMGKGAIPTDNELYVGNVGIHGSYAANSAVNNCDVLFSIGTRFNDRITGNIHNFAPKATVIRIDIDKTSISGKINIDFEIEADAKAAVNFLLKKAVCMDTLRWRNEINLWKNKNTAEQKAGVTPQKIISAVNNIFDDAVIVTDVGQNQMWTAQFIELNYNKKLLTSGGMGTMGYGLPAGIGAQIGNSDSIVIVISGDGGIQMNIQELATAVINELPIIVCIMNNGYLGNVRQWQQMFHNKRYSGVCMQYRKICEKCCNKPHAQCPKYTPDFVKLAESYGAKAIRVVCPNDIVKALIKAKKNRKTPTIIEFIIDREENVLPIVPPGRAINDMLLNYDKK